MNKMTSILMLILITLITATVNAELIQYNLGVDDYGDLSIDGVLVANYDGSAQGGDMTDVLDLSPGWHDIEILIKNRWGSSSVGLYTFDQGVNTVVPLEYLRSLDAQGSVISGLKADYYTLGGTTPYKTIYGEGPINHVSGDRLYQNEYGTVWGGTAETWVGLSDTFEERLSGQINVVPVPPPVLLGILGLGVTGLKLRKYA